MYSSTAETSPRALGPALVIGGSEFVGFHIISALLTDPTWGPVAVYQSEAGSQPL